MFMRLAIAVIMIGILTGCSSDQDCLNLVRKNYNDRDSLKVINSETNSGRLTLTITATNGYGARMQSKIFCSLNPNGKVIGVDVWETKHHEFMDEMNKRLDQLNRDNDRLRRGY